MLFFQYMKITKGGIRMIEIKYPNGNSIQNATEKNVIELLDSDFTLWLGGSGVASVSTDIKSKKSNTLIIIKISANKIFVSTGTIAPYNINLGIDIVEHYVGGNPMYFPNCSFVNRKKAEYILLEFVRTGIVEDFDKWRDIYDFIVPYPYDVYIGMKYEEIKKYKINNNLSESLRVALISFDKSECFGIDLKDSAETMEWLRELGLENKFEAANSCIIDAIMKLCKD